MSLVACGTSSDSPNTSRSTVIEHPLISIQVVDSFPLIDSSYMYSVYVSDTNWSQILEFSERVTSRQSEKATIDFYNDKEMTPKFMYHGGVSRKYDAYRVCFYCKRKSDGRFKLFMANEDNRVCYLDDEGKLKWEIYTE